MPRTLASLFIDERGDYSIPPADENGFTPILTDKKGRVYTIEGLKGRGGQIVLNGKLSPNESYKRVIVTKGVKDKRIVIRTLDACYSDTFNPFLEGWVH